MEHIFVFGNSMFKSGSSAVIVDRGTRKLVVLAHNLYFIPFTFISTIVNIYQICTVEERKIPNAGHAFGNGHTGQACAFVERPIPNLGHTIWNGHTG